jgi:hypothetical protein
VRAALAINDDKDTREMLADALLSQGKPDEAEPLLQHIIDEKRTDRAFM